MTLGNAHYCRWGPFLKVKRNRRQETLRGEARFALIAGSAGPDGLCMDTSA
jgi:hypothetical protein